MRPTYLVLVARYGGHEQTKVLRHLQRGRQTDQQAADDRGFVNLSTWRVETLKDDSTLSLACTPTSAPIPHYCTAPYAALTAEIIDEYFTTRLKGRKVSSCSCSATLATDMVCHCHAGMLQSRRFLHTCCPDAYPSKHARAVDDERDRSVCYQLN